MIVPKKQNVSEILRDYLETVNFPSVEEEKIIEAIEDLFNSACGVMLLYRFERPAYSEILKKYVNKKKGKNKKLSEIYGAEHLLRLLQKFPSLLKMMVEDFPEDVQLMLDTHVDGILKYLDTNQKDLFSPKNYESSSPEYQRLNL